MSLEAEIRSFRVDMPEEAIADLRRRIADTRSWVEKSYPNVTYFNEVDRGGHFAAWEEPDLFASEIRAAFRPLR
jgi:pimeloyl-ACP methyl ester carboxylesterase